MAEATDTATTPGVDPAARLYDERFARGYLESWPAAKLARVGELVRSLPLPERGRALDFGCGAGVFTRVLAEALPGWAVTGADISLRALERARQKTSEPRVRFAPLDELATGSERFDFVFTHHVLEHVVDLEETLDRIDALLAARAGVLHILPCGNPGSLEHRICTLRRDGFEPDRGGRFCFEEPGHLRRLDSATLAGACAQRRLKLAREHYACHHAGAINWITRCDDGFIRSLLDPERAVDASAARELGGLRRRLLRLARWRRAPARLRGARRLLLAPLVLAGRALDRRCTAADEREWRERRHDPSGSEMYLYLERCDAGGPETPPRAS